MGWGVVLGLALVSFGLITFVFKAPRKGWEAIGAALLLGIAGFATQARLDQPGAPKVAAQTPQGSGAALVEARKELAGQGQSTAVGGNYWMVVSDAMTRNGQFGDAAGIVAGAVEKNPRNSEAWLSLANNLVGHAEGALSPAALYAYRRAAEADPSQPGPAFFLGLALLANGRPAEGRALWAEMLARMPKDDPRRADLEARFARLDAMLKDQAEQE